MRANEVVENLPPDNAGSECVDQAIGILLKERGRVCRPFAQVRLNEGACYFDDDCRSLE